MHLHKLKPREICSFTEGMYWSFVILWYVKALVVCVWVMWAARYNFVIFQPWTQMLHWPPCYFTMLWSLMDNLTRTKRINLLCVRVCVKRCFGNVVQCACVSKVMVGGVIAVYWSPAAWCLRNEGVSSVLLGASNTDQLMENIGAIQVRPQYECVCVCVCVCLCARVCGSAEQISGLICENATWPVSSDLVFVPYSPYQQPTLLGTARPLGQFAAARLGALLYRVNKVSGVSVARGIGDRLTATSSLSW